MRVRKFIGRITGRSNLSLNVNTVQSPIEVDDNQTAEIRLPYDILDHIFSFLKPHPRALYKCSEAHPILSQIVERYRFHRIIIKTGFSDIAFSLNTSQLLKHLAETPRIANYVTVLQIDFDSDRPHLGAPLEPTLNEIASLMPMFPVLECIILSTRKSFPASLNDLPQSFRKALENCLCLPTLQEVHIGKMAFPLSMLDNHTNINYLSLSHLPEVEPEYLETTYPQIKFLALDGFDYRHHSNGFATWAERHITQLQSLKYDFSCNKMISPVLDVCSDTLENLYIHLYRSPHDSSFMSLSSLSRLRNLTIHTEVFFKSGDIEGEITRRTFFVYMFKILETAPPLEQLTIEVFLDLSVDGSCLIWAELSLGMLTELSIRFDHLDIYMYTGLPHLPITHTLMRSLLEGQEGVIKLIEQGVLVLHPEETAPTMSRVYTPRESKPCIIM